MLQETKYVSYMCLIQGSEHKIELPDIGGPKQITQKSFWNPHNTINNTEVVYV